MIVIKLAGGLGNQLFQYAFGRKISLSEKQQLIFETSAYQGDYLGRQISLTNYNIRFKSIKDRIIKIIFTHNTKLNIFFIKFSLLEERPENNFTFKRSFLETKKPITFYSGYWQSFKYFQDIRSTLLNELTPINTPPLPTWTQLENTVAVGIRRTDYLKDLRYGFIGEKYYDDAIALVKEKLHNPLFIVFSDDLEWSRNYFRNDNVIFCDQQEWMADYLSLFLISVCKHQIIGNSSFHWWGAWLNQNQNKLVIRPSRPFNDPSLLYEFHYPEQWMVVNSN